MINHHIDSESNQNSLTTKVHVSELQLGMQVAELDREWLGTPFLFQGFTIETLEEIDTLAEYCEHVWVSTKHNYIAEKTTHETLKTKGVKQVHIQKIASPQQLAMRSKIFNEARVATKGLLEEIRLGNALNTEQAKTTVKHCVDGIMADPDTMMLLAKLREKDNYTTEHSMNVCVLAVCFGRALGFNQIELNNIGLCGILHDVGKMKIPPDVLNKVEPLTKKEWNMIAAHPVHGRNILLKADNIYHGCVDVAYSHHERIDGEGYPRKLSGAGISHYAKIISICDAYDAMTANRCYKNAIPTTKALKILFDNRDTQFDRHLVDLFIEMIGLYPPGSVVQLKNGCIAIVLSRNLKYQHLPRVLIVRDERQQPCTERVVNLAHTEQDKLDNGYLIAHDLCDGSFDVYLKNYTDKGLTIAV